MTVQYRLGDVILVEDVLDSRGHGTKTRPVVALCNCDAATLVGVAVTSVYSPDDAEYAVRLPYGNVRRGCTTGLEYDSWAVCYWRVDLNRHVVLKRIGHIPTLHLQRIMQVLATLADEL